MNGKLKMLNELIKEAKKGNKLIHNKFSRNLYTPNEVDNLNGTGIMNHGSAWELKDPEKMIDQIEDQVYELTRRKCEIKNKLEVMANEL